MRLEPTENGFVIDAEDLGRLLGRPPAEVQRLMREGAITTRSETGLDEDAGRSRVTFFDGEYRVRVIVNEAGEVLKQSRIRLTHPPDNSRAGPPRGDASGSAREKKAEHDQD